jgi:DNA-binding response OmpR family regulator
MNPKIKNPEKKKNVLLLIEDNPLLTGLYKEAFEREGLEVYFAHNGEDGLKLAQEKKPQLVVLDLLMPGIDGFEVLRCLKRDPATRRAAVVVLTVVTDEEKRKEAERLGAADYLVKEELELNEIVKRVLSHLP